MRTKLGKSGSQRLFCEVAFRNKAFSISFNAGNSAAGTRDNQTDFLAGHCLSVVEQERLHGCRHIAPPKRRTDDNGIVFEKVHVYRINGGIRKSVIRLSFEFGPPNHFRENNC